LKSKKTVGNVGIGAKIANSDAHFSDTEERYLQVKIPKMLKLASMKNCIN